MKGSSGTPMERLRRKLIVSETGCWIVRCSPRNGYGHISDRRRTMYAHRFMYEALVGPVPDGLDLDHLCRNRLCCNPDHLEPVTRKANLDRAFAVRPKPTRCPSGHAYTEENTYMSQGKYRVCRTCRRIREAAA
jgi:hypothetical protein